MVDTDIITNPSLALVNATTLLKFELVKPFSSFCADKLESLELENPDILVEALTYEPNCLMAPQEVYDRKQADKPMRSAQHY